MKNIFFGMLFLMLFTSCSNKDEIDPTLFNSELSIVENLENGVAVLDITNALSAEALYGLEYGGGYIFYVDPTDGTLMVATDYATVGALAWGDHFDLTTSTSIGDGLENTQQIVDGNSNDNSLVPNGLEFGSDNYVFKKVLDLEYEGFDDWFVPSSGSMKAIYDNVHAQNMGNFNETFFYWTSTKSGYFPYVMGFNLTWGGAAFSGSCFDVNGALIARKITP
jgi:hypothetical protein